MANQEHLAILDQGVSAWNEWRRANPQIRPDLEGVLLRQRNLTRVDFSDTDLYHANLEGALLVGANMARACLVHASLTGASLDTATLVRANLDYATLDSNLDDGLNEVGYTRCDGADFGEARLENATLKWTQLRRCNFGRANLVRSYFSGSQLSGADLAGATVGYTTLAEIDLSSVAGLDKIHHLYPSFIDLTTIRLSGGLPDSFLQGCGVPQSLIEYLPALLGQAIQFYSCFISYSSKDQSFADRLHADLQDNGVRCWFAPHDMRGGRKIHEQIDEAIRLHDRLLLILSLSSIGSEWVRTEIAKARRREVRERKRVLFPIKLCNFEELRDWECFDADIGKDTATEIREYFIADFTKWEDHGSYQAAFQRLLRDLRSEVPK
jgi:uncharacterized protein YjbI with pentapeptide repeats